MLTGKINKHFFKKKIKPNLNDLESIENDLVQFLTAFDISKLDQFSIKLLLHEYLRNIIEHGFKAVEDGLIFVSIDCKEKERNYDFAFTFLDNSPAFNPLKDLKTRKFEDHIGLNLICRISEDSDYLVEGIYNCYKASKTIERSLEINEG